MVGAAGIVASAVNNSRQRRESRTSQNQPYDRDSRGGLGSRTTISEILASRHMLASGAVPGGPGGGLTKGLLDASGNKLDKPDPIELPPEKMSLKEQIKFYVSLSLGIIASICVFALLFLIPLVVEPSISTLFADFDPEAATCVTVDFNIATGLTKCGEYSSCREGCTSTPSQCHQLYVNYRKANKPGFPPIKNFTILNSREVMDLSKWDVSSTQLLINAKGCGYPPRVKCEDFYEIYAKDQLAFPCFYSRANPRLVVIDYNWEETAFPLLFSLGIPVGLFTVSIAVLSFWYCPFCEERGKNKRPCRSRYTIPKPQNDEILNEKNSKKEIKKNVENNPVQQPILQQPRRKLSGHRPNSPSLATISSRDTTASSISSLNDGWQSPPSPPPRIGNRHNNSSRSNLTRARKL